MPKEDAAGMVPFCKLFAFADALDVALMTVGGGAAVGNGVALPLSALFFGHLINAFGSSSGTGDVLHHVSEIVLKFVYVAVAAGGAAFLQVSCWTIAGERQAARIRGLYLKAILRQDMAFFDTETTTGEVIWRMSGDTGLVQDAMGENVGKFLQFVSTFFAGLVIAFVEGRQLALVMVFSLVPLLAAGAASAVVVSKMSGRAQSGNADAGDLVEQTVGSIRTVAAFSGEEPAVARYDRSLWRAYGSTVKEGLAAGVGLGVVLLMIFCNYGRATWYGGELIAGGGGYDGGTVVNVLIAIMTGGISLGQVTPCVNAFAVGLKAAHRMFETIERRPEIDAGDPRGAVLEALRGDLELREVTFRYPGRPEVLVLDGFSLRVAGGTTAALVGESGAGKSTVISLVARFYDPQGGEVLVDGVDIRKLRLRWIREKIGLVSQEPVLFSTTIRENVAYARPDATAEEINAAVELANAANFIHKMPAGMDSMVGERGAQLSGGQKQRIAIARAILKNPRFLLLDEATSALDAESERLVQEALSRIMADRTTIVAAHRLHMVHSADMIAVVRSGRIVEQGPHAELVRDPEGPYSRLICLQESEPPEEDGRGGPANVSGNSQRHVYFTEPLSDSRGSSMGGGRSQRFPVGAISLPDGGGGDQVRPRKSAPIWRLARLNKPEIPVLLLGAVAAAIHGAAFPTFGVLFSGTIRIFFEPPPELRRQSRFWALMYCLLGVVSLVAVPLKQYLFAVAGGKLVLRIRSLSFRKVLQLEMTWFDDPSNSSGAIATRLSADAAAVRGLVGDSLALVVQNSATVAAGLAIAMAANWRLALIILALIPLVGLQGSLQMKFLAGFSADAKVKYLEATQVASDAVGGIRTVAAFCAEDKVEAYHLRCRAPARQGLRQGVATGLGFGFSSLVLYCAYALIFYARARFVQDGKATFAQVFRVFFALAMTAIGVSKTSALGPDTNKGRDSAASLFAILDRRSEIDPGGAAGRTLAVVRGDVAFQNVSFRYPTCPDVPRPQGLLPEHPRRKDGGAGGGERERQVDGDRPPGALLRPRRRPHPPRRGGPPGPPALLAQAATGPCPPRARLLQRYHPSQHRLRQRRGGGDGGRRTASSPASPRGTPRRWGRGECSSPAGRGRGSPSPGRCCGTPGCCCSTSPPPRWTLRRSSPCRRRTTVVVAHRLSTIKWADAIAVLRNGEVVETGTHAALLGEPIGAYQALMALHHSSPQPKPQ